MADRLAYQTLLVEVASGVATVTLNRPEARNALNPTMVEELGRALLALDDAPEARAIVVRGAGDRAFCAGADLKGMFDSPSVLEARDRYAGLVRIFESIPRMRTPVIAQVHGYALAGGCGLAVACDLVIASDDAVFGLPEVKLGLLPLIVLAPILRAASAPKRVLELVLTGAELRAPEAVALGLVNRVVPRDALEATARRLAETIAGYSPATVALGKEAFYRALELEYGAALGYLRDVLTVVTRSDDAREGITAFLEKRAPRWSGR